MDKEIVVMRYSVVIQGTGYIDEIEFHKNPSRSRMEVVVVRKIAQIQRALTFEQQRPGWERFARARQGGE